MKENYYLSAVYYWYSIVFTLGYLTIGHTVRPDYTCTVGPNSSWVLWAKIGTMGQRSIRYHQVQVPEHQQAQVPKLQQVQIPGCPGSTAPGGPTIPVVLVSLLLAIMDISIDHCILALLHCICTFFVAFKLCCIAWLSVHLSCQPVIVWCNQIYCSCP